MFCELWVVAGKSGSKEIRYQIKRLFMGVWIRLVVLEIEGSGLMGDIVLEIEIYRNLQDLLVDRMWGQEKGYIDFGFLILLIGWRVVLFSMLFGGGDWGGIMRLKGEVLEV